MPPQPSSHVKMSGFDGSRKTPVDFHDGTAADGRIRGV